MTVDDFFRDLTGHAPYPYQRALAVAPELPARLDVPTGAGKTEAVLVAWMWRAFAAPDDVRRATPRRLVYCLPMRTLVEQTADVAERLLAAARARMTVGTAGDVRVHRLLGGFVDDSFEDRPEAFAIVVGTQDMLLSRALNRGYGMSRYRWPVQFGLLHNDCLWVFDETQLMGPGLSTAAQLEAFRRDPRTPTVRPCRSLWMSATLDESRLRTVDLRETDLPRLALAESDADQCAPLARRLRAVKRLTRASAAGDDLPSLAQEIRAAHVTGTRTLVVVNRVARARALHGAIRKALGRGAGAPDVRVIHSRFRAGDRRRIAQTALAPDWHGILVATQVVEAGVDVSSRTMFTDLAPWSSMVQRFGRCNRAGEWADGADVRWIDLDASGDGAAPYEPAHLVASREKLAGLRDVGIAGLRAVADGASGPALPVLRRKDLLDLFDTTPDLTGQDVDVARFVRDAEARDVFVVWRDFPADGAPPDGADEPRDAETCRVAVHELRDFLKRTDSSAYVWNGLASSWQRRRGTDAERLAPGTTVLLAAACGGYSDELGWTGDPHDVPAPVAGLVPAGAPDSDSGDPQSQAGDFVALALHSADVAAEMRSLRDTLGGDSPWAVLERAARWHDVGKAHAAFQRTMQASAVPDVAVPGPGPWAKSPGRARHDRRHFRHELVSALAWLAHGGDALGAYLVAAHHGKVRTSIRSRPGERRPADAPGAAAPGDDLFALGVVHGESIPACDLGDGHQVPATVLDLRRAMVGDDDGNGAWSGLAAALLAEHGPFRLAYWEALVRIADWRASARRDRRPVAHPDSAPADPGVAASQEGGGR